MKKQLITAAILLTLVAVPNTSKAVSLDFNGSFNNSPTTCHEDAKGIYVFTILSRLTDDCKKVLQKGIDKKIIDRKDKILELTMENTSGSSSTSSSSFGGSFGSSETKYNVQARILKYIPHTGRHLPKAITVKYNVTVK